MSASHSADEHLMQTYARLPVTFVRGEGPWLWDDAGGRYLDCLSGIAVCGIGHAHPAVTRAVCDQAGQLVHTSNLYGIARQRELADRLAALTGLERAFFCNSGAEANEAAIKLARLHAHNHAISRPVIVVADSSFHGRTLGTLSATGNTRAQEGFGPLLDGFERVPYGDIDALQGLTGRDDVVAVLLEPIQGEGGVRIPSPLPGYLEAVRELCDEQGWLMMLDEVQSGTGRSGRLFAFQHSGALPDVLTVAKGLGNGIPIGAALARGPAAEVLTPGSHGSTFGGNPVACAAALAVLNVLENEDLPAHAAALGERILGALQARLGSQAGVSDIRGCGLLIGIELNRPCGALVRRALDAGLLINVTAECVVRLLPPLILTPTQADEMVDRVATLIETFLHEQG